MASRNQLDVVPFKEISTSNNHTNTESVRDAMLKTPRPDGQPTTSSQTSGLDHILEDLGNPGLFVCIQFILRNVSHLGACFTALVFVFTAYQPPHRCATLVNETDVINQYGRSNDSSAFLKYNECNIELWSNTTGHLKRISSMKCLNGNYYGGKRHISLVSEWDYVCEQRSGLVEFIQTALGLGQMVGAAIVSSVADKVGRKPIFIICNLAQAVTGIISAFSPNIYFLIVMSFLMGVFQQGYGTAGWTLIMENFLPRHRPTGGALTGVFWNVGMFLLIFTAWMLKDSSWRILQLVTGLLGLNAIISIFFLSESPRWLIANKKYDQALTVLKRICKINGKDFSKVEQMFNGNIRTCDEGKALILINQTESRVSGVEITSNQDYSVIDILRHTALRYNSLVIWVVWFSCGTVWFGLALTSSYLAGDRYLNFLLLAIVDVPADFIIFFFMDRIGRRFLTISSLALTATGLLTSSLLMAYGASHLTGSLTTVFFLVGRFGIAICYNTIYIYSLELFPTNIRSSGVGVSSSVSRIGGMIAPYARVLADVLLWGPGAVFTALCFISVIISFKLPETSGRSLPTFAEEMETWQEQETSETTDSLLNADTSRPGSNNNNGLRKRTDDRVHV